MVSKSHKERATTASDLTVGIYQNSDHIAGLLQQLFAAPLVIGESRESARDKTDDTAKKLQGRAEGTGEAKASFLAKLGGGLAGDAEWLKREGLAAGTKTTQNFTYSQAYYLFIVYQELAARGLLRTIESASDAKKLKPGDFVEYQATFRPNALHALLDILTPDFVAAFTEHRVKSEELTKFEGIDTFEQQKIFSEQMQLKATTRADLARAIAEAIRVDFRAAKTREFYGTIGDVTAITICDGPHFSVEDEDRILDGTFTVLGKVTSEVTEDLPVLSRNKVLERLGPDLVDSLFKSLRENATTEARNIRLGDEEFSVDDAFDLALPARIKGPSFKVVPIAIYA